MIKKTNISNVGSSFHGVEIRATLNELYSALGEDNQGPSGDGKTQCEWTLSYKGKTFSLYDWKEDRYNDNTPIDWHIGSKYSASVEQEFKDELLKMIGR